MKVYIQCNHDNQPYSVNGYIAMQGFQKMGFEIVYFQKLSDVEPGMQKEDIVVGGIATVNSRLNHLGIYPAEINYPKELKTPFVKLS